MISLKHVLVATDFGEAADAALAYGQELARTFGARLDVLHVVDNVLSRGFGVDGYVASYGDLQQDLEDAARRQLDALVTTEDRQTLQARPIVLTSNSPASTITTFALDEHVDLTIVGTHGRGALAHLLMGSVAERVVRTAPCPVLAVHHPEQEFVKPDALVAVARSACSA
jgi:nucleotide-binding universal stress UspA family protein